MVDEGYTAVRRAGPEIVPDRQGRRPHWRIDARSNLDALTTLIDQSAPVLDTQTDTSDSIQAWASHLATITGQLRDQRLPLRRGASTTAARQPTRRANSLTACNRPCRSYWPTWSASARSRSTTNPHIEQLLVLFPQGTANLQGQRRRRPEHQAGLQGRLPELQPQPQSAATMHHRVPAGPAAPHTASVEDTRPSRRRPLLPGPAGLDHSTSAAPRTYPCLRPGPASARRRVRCAKATSSTCHSTTATTGRVTRTPP